MDGNQFDKLAKAMASTSRRSILKAAAGMVLGTGLAAARIGGVAAGVPRKPGQVCRKDGDCASNHCGPLNSRGRGICLCDEPEDCPVPGNKCKVATCTESGRCGVAARDCDDGNACTIDTCDRRTGQCVHTAKNCDDNNLCTTDTCDPQTGTCIHNPINCDDGNACTTDTCDRGTGRCVYTAKNCDDNNKCTADTCDPQTGTCIHTPINCNDNNACTVDSCDPQTGCVNTPINCEPESQCHTASCNPATGCISTPKTNGAPCDDGNPKTCNDVCTAGVCAGTEVDLDTDTDNCGTCGNVCASDETCSAGECVSLCQPNCTSRNCGSDGCGGSCGTCSFPNQCNEQSGICTCTPNCTDRQCGSDGCGGSCGTCETGFNCRNNRCVACSPNGTQCIGASCLDCCHSTVRNGLGSFFCGCVPPDTSCASTPAGGGGTDVNCLNCCTPLNADSGTCPGGT